MINPHIGIAGNIGAGKTTLTEKLTSKFDWIPIYESVVDNPYLEDFYENMSKWSFNLQIYFLNHRFQNQVSLSNMIAHSKSVRLGVKRSLMVVDMPFNTYISKKVALKNLSSRGKKIE